MCFFFFFLFFCLLTSHLEKYAVQHHLAHKKEKSSTVSKECTISALVVGFL